jgi:hypothetical protein
MEPSEESTTIPHPMRFSASNDPCLAILLVLEAMQEAASESTEIRLRKLSGGWGSEREEFQRSCQSTVQNITTGLYAHGYRNWTSKVVAPLTVSQQYIFEADEDRYSCIVAMWKDLLSRDNRIYQSLKHLRYIPRDNVDLSHIFRSLLNRISIYQKWCPLPDTFTRGQ